MIVTWLVIDENGLLFGVLILDAMAIVNSPLSTLGQFPLLYCQTFAPTQHDADAMQLAFLRSLRLPLRWLKFEDFKLPPDASTQNRLLSTIKHIVPFDY